MTITVRDRVATDQDSNAEKRAVAARRLRLRRELDAEVMQEEFWGALFREIEENLPPNAELPEPPPWLTLEGWKGRFGDRNVPARVRRYELEAWRGLAALFRLRHPRNPDEELLLEFVAHAIVAAHQIVLIRFPPESGEPAFVRKSKKTLLELGIEPEDRGTVLAEIAALREAHGFLDAARGEANEAAPLPRHPAEV